MTMTPSRMLMNVLTGYSKIQGRRTITHRAAARIPTTRPHSRPFNTEHDSGDQVHPTPRLDLVVVDKRVNLGVSGVERPQAGQDPVGAGEDEHDRREDRPPAEAGPVWCCHLPSWVRAPLA
jgi:hypothetical protein